MGTKTLITPEQYLSTHFEREPEYVRGELKEKPSPDRLHSWIVSLLMQLLNSRRGTHSISAETEVRCRLAPDLYRIPDIAVFSLNEPFDLVPSKPPLVVIEVLSKDDRASDLVVKLSDYERWGVPRIWVVDPWAKRLAVWKNGDLLAVEALTLPEYDFKVRLDQLIEGLPL